MDKRYELTYPQKNIWLVENFYDNPVMNIIAGSLIVKKDFNFEIAEKTVNKFVELNEAPRLKIGVVEGNVVQTISPYVPFDSKKVDISKMTEDEIQKLKREYMERPIDILGGTLLTYMLLDKGNGEGEIFLKSHHIVSDAWSTSKMGSMLSDIYEKFLAGEEYSESAPSYMEFIASEQEYLASEKYAKDTEFWREYLKGLTESIGLKEDIPNKSNKAKRYSLKLSKEFEEELNAFCKVHRLSVYTVFLSALAIYMHRINEKDDFVIGTPTLNRANFKEKMMQGMFVSTMPVRFKIDEKTTFIDFCKSNASESMQLFRHQRYPYSHMSEEYKKENDVTENMYKVMFSYQNARAEFAVEDKYEIDWIFTENIQDQMEIHVMDLNDSGIFELHFDYLTDLFEDIEVEYMAQRILAIVTDGIKNNKTIETIEIMPEEEKNKILYDFNDTKRDYPKDKTVIDLFEEQVEKTPNAVALVFEDKTMTYKELNERANQVAHYLQINKFANNNKIGVMVEKSFELLISIIGILKIGAIYVPLDNNYTNERKKYILNDCSCKILITDENMNINIKSKNIYEIDKDLSKKNYIRDISLNAESVNCILYTSGTTGEPKGAVIVNRNIVKLVKNADYLDFDSKDKILQTSSVVFDVSLFDFWSALLNGAALCLIKKEDLLDFEYLYKYMQNNNMSIMCMTSALFNQIIDNKIEIFNTLRAIMVGGDVMSVTHVKKLFDRYPEKKLINCYGPTECTSFCNTFLVKSENKITIGKPISNTASYIVDQKNRLLPIFCKGEYVVSGDGVAKGYINKETLTAKKFIPNPFKGNYYKNLLYKTGDYASFIEDGNVNFMGRMDNQIKIRGYRIELDEIKNVVLQIENIKDAVIVVQEDKDNKSNKSILLYYVADKKILEKDIVEYLIKKLPINMIPSGIMKIDKIPMNVNLKLDKKQLPEIKNSKRNSNEENLNKTEKIIQKIIFDIVGKILMKEEDFFASGIDSLNSINISIQITNVFQKPISVKEIFEFSSIQRLALYIDELKIKKMIKQKEDIGVFNLSHSQKNIFYDYMKNQNTKNYNISFELVLEKNIDVDKLKKAIEDTIKFNKKMNSEIYIDNGEIKYKIKTTNCNIQIFEIAEFEYKKIKKEYVRLFDLLKAPLYNINIYKTKQKVYILFDIHHIIFDGVSFTIFMKQIQDLYQGKKIIKQKIYKNITDFEVKYKDKSKKYFEKMFSKELPINNMPLDYLRKKEKSVEGIRINKQINNKLYKKVLSFSKQNNVTISSITQSAYIIALSKYMYSDDVIIGMVSSGRYTEKDINEIGTFVHTIPYRYEINWQDSSLEFIKKNQKQIIEEIYYNREYKYDEIIENMDIEKVSNKGPLFDNVFICQNIGTKKIKLNNTDVEINELERKSSKFDMTLEFVPMEENAYVNLEYCTKLFKKKSMINFINNYIKVLNQIIDNGKKQIYEIDMISEKEKNKLVKDFNNNKTKYPKEKTVNQIFEENVVKYSNKTAVVFQKDFITYEELNRKANKFARHLIKKGVLEGDVIAVMIDKSIEYMVAIIAILKCNAVYTPIIDDLPDERAKYMIENSNSRYIISTKGYYRNISDTKVIYIDDEEKYIINSTENLNLINDSENLLHVIYTSGSTGIPKGNMIKHKGMIRLLMNTNYVQYTKKDIMLASGSLTFDISGFEIWGAMMYGMTLHLIKKDQTMDVKYYEKYLIENKITTTFLATPIFHMLVDANPKMFRNMNSIYIGGEVLLPKYTNLFIKNNKKTKIYNAYGPAEITVICCAKHVNKIFNQDIPLGSIVSNNNCYILDKCNKLCPINVPGELYVTGDGMGKGYINREDLTKEKFIYVDGIKGLAYKSGDLTKWNEKGEIRYIGRIDTQVKIRGQRIELTEIQNKIVEYKYIKEVAVKIINIKDKKYIVSFFTSNKKIIEKDLKEYLQQYLPKYMIPYKCIQIDKLPYNQNGKVDLKSLPEVEVGKKEKIIQPINNNQKRILDVYRKVLETDEFGMSSDFFENGGDSLMVAKLMSDLKDKDIEIVYGDAFKYTTPMQMYNYIFFNKSEQKIIQDIKNIDYKEINKLLKSTFEKEVIKIQTEKIQTVVLTGATGFLGVHLLYDMMMDSNIRKIYCIVRKKNTEDSLKRFKKKLKFFYNCEEVKKIIKKCVIIENDITNKNISDIKFNEKIDAIINTAGYVKHYGDAISFFETNVNGTKNLIDMAIKNNCKLIHCSTISVSGNFIEAGQNIQNNICKDTIFDESKLYINQNIDNLYVYTKFLAEVEILTAIINKNLRATILRIGNLTSRYTDSKFQINIQDNAFANRIKTMLELRILPKSIANKYIEMTPVDYCSSSIVKILQIKNDLPVLHIYNNNHLMLKKLHKILLKHNIDLKILKDNEMRILINTLLKDEKSFSKLEGIMPDIDKEGNLQYNTTTEIRNQKTNNILLKLNFKWPMITEKYFIEYLKYLTDIGFIKLEVKND